MSKYWLLITQYTIWIRFIVCGHLIESMNLIWLFLWFRPLLFLFFSFIVLESEWIFLTIVHVVGSVVWCMIPLIIFTITSYRVLISLISTSISWSTSSPSISSSITFLWYLFSVRRYIFSSRIFSFLSSFFRVFLLAEIILWNKVWNFLIFKDWTLMLILSLPSLLNICLNLILIRILIKTKSLRSSKIFSVASHTSRSIHIISSSSLKFKFISLLLLCVVFYVIANLVMKKLF